MCWRLVLAARLLQLARWWHRWLCCRVSCLTDRGWRRLRSLAAAADDDDDSCVVHDLAMCAAGTRHLVARSQPRGEACVIVLKRFSAGGCSLVSCNWCWRLWT